MLHSIRGRETKWAGRSLEFEYRAGLRPAVTRGGGVRPAEMSHTAGIEIVALTRSEEDCHTS